MSAVKDSEPKAISDLMKKWFLNSPSNGIRRIVRAKTFIASLFLGYGFWVFTVFMVCFINIAIFQYMAHPTKIHLTVRQYRDPEHFPAITFCNLNPLKDDEFLDDQKKNRLPGSGPTSDMTESEYRKIVADYMERILGEQVNGTRHPLIKWGFHLNELLITCTYNKQVCHRNLTRIFHPNYGNCYTFDNNDHIQGMKVNDIRYDWSIYHENSEKNYRLFLELFLHQKEYNSFLGHRAGLRIFIHRKKEIPMLSETSLFIGPNKYTSLSFLPRVMSFSQNCRNNLTEQMKQIFPSQQVRYTQALCYKVCEDRFVVNRCRCIEPTLAVFYQFFNDKFTVPDIKLCSMTSKCLATRGYFNASKLCPECLPECEIIQYSVQSSYALYPNIKASEKVSQRVRNHLQGERKISAYLSHSFDGSSTNPQKSLQNNIVAVEISASPYATEILTESPVYTWVDLISNIGGQTSLWIGISLISFVEILEIFYILLHHFYVYLTFYWQQK